MDEMVPKGREGRDGRGGRGGEEAIKYMNLVDCGRRRTVPWASCFNYVLLVLLVSVLFIISWLHPLVGRQRLP